MLSLKRLANIVLIAIIISTMFFLFNLNNDFIKASHENAADTAPVAVPVFNGTIFSDDYSYIIAGEPENLFETNVKANVEGALNTIKVNYKNVSSLNSEDYADLSKVIIIINQNLSNNFDLEMLADFVKNGGKIVLSAGLPEIKDSVYLNPVFGILERGEYQLYDDLRFLEGSIPYEQVELYDSYPTYSYTVRLLDTSKKLVETVDSVPLVWVNEYKKGLCAVINATFLESALSEGIFISTLSNINSSFVYPIRNSKTVFLDAIPALYTDNDDKSFKYYGRSAQSFVRDKLWNVLLQTSSTMDFKYTSSFLGVDKNNVDISKADSQTLAFICKQISNNKGEITLSGNHNGIDSLSLDRCEDINQFFSSIFPNYEIHAYYPLYGKINLNDFEVLKQSFNHLNILRSRFYGDEKSVYVSDFDLQDDGTVIFPTITSGYKADGMQMYTFLSLLTSRGVVSHSFDINSLFTTPVEDSNWNALDEHYQKLCEKFFLKTPWLTATTVSQAAASYKAGESLVYETKTDENSLTIKCDNYVDGQKFLLRSDDIIENISGATYEIIGNNYYLLTLSQGEIIIDFAR